MPPSDDDYDPQVDRARPVLNSTAYQFQQIVNRNWTAPERDALRTWADKTEKAVFG